MSENRNSKKYFWLKLNENFFESEEIKVIEDMKNGKDYIIFYMKLLLKSVGAEGALKFRGVIPYTPEMLASVTRTDVDTVRVATDMFIQLGLMEKWDDGTLFMSETQNMIGSETGWAKKKRNQRQKEDIVPLNKDNVPKLSPNCPIEIEKEKEIELDIELEEGAKTPGSSDKYKKIVDMYHNNGFGLITLESKEKIVELIEEYTEDWLIDALEVSIDSNKRRLDYTRGILKRWKSEGKDNKGGSNDGTYSNKPKQNTTKINGLTDEDAKRAGITRL